MFNFILPILKNPLTRIVADKTIGAIQHKMEKNKIIRATEIEAEKSVSIEQIKQQEHSLRLLPLFLKTEHELSLAGLHAGNSL